MKLMGVPSEEKLLADPVHVEHSIDFSRKWVDYPFDEMDKYDFFRIYDEQDARRTHTAIQRYYQREPVSAFRVTKMGDEWICRRLV